MGVRHERTERGSGTLFDAAGGAWSVRYRVSHWRRFTVEDWASGPAGGVTYDGAGEIEGELRMIGGSVPALMGTEPILVLATGDRLRLAIKTGERAQRLFTFVAVPASY